MRAVRAAQEGAASSDRRRNAPERGDDEGGDGGEWMVSRQVSPNIRDKIVLMYSMGPIEHIGAILSRMLGGSWPTI